MKKFFLFAAVAGMLASCSSESLTGSDPKIEPTQGERVPIQLGVASPSVRATTRGTGTVGGVGTGDNKWYGQRINVFMFVKNSLDLALEDPDDDNSKLYNDAVMITPGTTDNLVEGTAYQNPTEIGEAMLDGGNIKYYPPTGNFDFFAYHGDDAVAASSVVTTADPWVVPFTIDGSQDLMSTKAALLQEGAIKQETWMGESTDYYSAKAARKGVQPILKFDHLLSRLAFVIVPGNNNAGGWTPETYTAGEANTHNAGLTGAVAAGAAAPDDYNAKVGSAPANSSNLTEDEANAYNATLAGAVAAGDPKATGAQDPNKAVYVKSIKVESKTTGKMAVAWTNEPANKITWDNNSTPDNDADDGVPAWLTLKDRPAYKLLSAADNPAKYITATAYNQLPGTGDGDENSKDDYGQINPNANYNLIALAPTYPNMTHSYDKDALEPTEIGEALIVAPKDEAYNMKVTVSQTVPTNWNTIADPTTYEEKEVTYDLEIPKPDGGFKANTSYKVVLTVYGFERIQVTTMIIPWEQGADIPVGQD